jgi:hypothetical protein
MGMTSHGDPWPGGSHGRFSLLSVPPDIGPCLELSSGQQMLVEYLTQRCLQQPGRQLSGGRCLSGRGETEATE